MKASEPPSPWLSLCSEFLFILLWFFWNDFLCHWWTQYSQVFFASHPFISYSCAASCYDLIVIWLFFCNVALPAYVRVKFENTDFEIKGQWLWTMFPHPPYYRLKSHCKESELNLYLLTWYVTAGLWVRKEGNELFLGNRILARLCFTFSVTLRPGLSSPQHRGVHEAKGHAQKEPVPSS